MFGQLGLFFLKFFFSYDYRRFWGFDILLRYWETKRKKITVIV